MLSKDPAGRPTAAELVTELTVATTPDALLTPTQVRRQRWRKRGIYLAIAAAGAIPVIIIGIRVAFKFMSFMASGGSGVDPALLESGGAVPDSIVRLARETGSIAPSERVGLVFIPGNRTFDEALLVTDSVIIRRSPNGIRRASIEESDINLQPIQRGDSPGGLLIVTVKGQRPDTLYNDLSSREAFRLGNEFTAWNRARKAADSTAR
jgi:hypothetical protein